MIAEFVGVQDYDLEEVIQATSIDNTREKRRQLAEKAGVEFREHILYNTGKKNTWETKLSKEVQEYYSSFHYSLEGQQF